MASLATADARPGKPTAKNALPELKHKPSDYVLSGRYF